MDEYAARVMICGWLKKKADDTRVVPFVMAS